VAIARYAFSTSRFRGTSKPQSESWITFSSTISTTCGRQEAQKFWDWVAGLAAVPVVRSFREEMEKVRSTELAAAFRRLGPLSAEQAEMIEHFSKSLMNKFMHEPSVRLKAAAANGRGLGVVDAARYLFALEDKTHHGAPQASEEDA
jgi:hypothetical protein